MINLKFLLRLTLTWTIWSKGNTPTIRVEWGGGGVVSTITYKVQYL